jgi:uncharacterized protein YggE
MRKIAPPALALLVAGLLWIPAASAAERSVTVRGSATQTVPNDAARLGFGVSKVRSSRQAALHVVAVRLRAVIAAVEASPGVGSSDIATGQISVHKLVRSKQALFRASEGISVVLHEPDAAGNLVNAAVAAGATGTRGPFFFASNPEAAYNNTLVAAFDQAKAKAAALASRAGAVLGPATSIEEVTEAVPIEGSPNAKGAPATEAPPVKPGASTVTATVRVVFALE